VWPLLQPMSLPIDVSPPVQTLYDAIEAIPEGSIVMLGADYSPDTMPELQPMVGLSPRSTAKSTASTTSTWATWQAASSRSWAWAPAFRIHTRATTGERR
jgi:hypothetical protein